MVALPTCRERIADNLQPSEAASHSTVLRLTRYATIYASVRLINLPKLRSRSHFEFIREGYDKRITVSKFRVILYALCQLYGREINYIIGKINRTCYVPCLPVFNWLKLLQASSVMVSLL